MSVSESIRESEQLSIPVENEDTFEDSDEISEEMQSELGPCLELAGKL